MLLVIDNDGYIDIEYRTVFDSLANRICQLKKERIHIESRAGNSSMVSEGKFEDLVERSEFIEKKKYYAVTFLSLHLN